ncbi:Steroid receptor RNA activator 1 [Eumeta japonica]|uniref:Steroid receptor RNA activator 1 n=1 Tax=Eumeta variegata TaxID=151549 RepID=A0A4C1TEP6_EUMVA|nr:Steroid receptor RNA activator 1 [Eumeta japonica]
MRREPSMVLPPFLAAFDPGWNDPPTFSYNIQHTQATRPRNFLNKRVAFPLTGANADNAPKSLSALPSNLPMPPAAPLQTILKPVQTREEIVADSESTLKEVKDILLKIVDDSSELGNKANDIKKRIHTMEEMWRSEKLNNSIKLLMKELAYALKDDQPTKADDIHRVLMVDHIGAVGAWMPGVKQLVYHCIARSELIAIDKES